ncbi:MAG TPA: DUF1549 and DUF1553 domain-containing protein [Gemmataceae bacterium]|nr:DUF1549 and DUF1553 domain-containing protein [Gemmataceae bacterium]
MHAASMSRFLAFCFISLSSWLLFVPLAGAADISPKPESKPEKVDFERDVMGLLGRMGCNSGSCHGSFQGRNGFRLSLFGFDPERDYRAITRDGMGRRINLVDPDKSLLLQKALGIVEHGGGRRFGRDSWQYRLVYDWIADGALWVKGSGDIKSLSVNPPEVAFLKPGQSRTIQIMAKFADGTEKDVTLLCDTRVNDDAIAEIANSGVITARRAGDTAIVAAYRGYLRAARVLVPLQAPTDFHYPDLPENNFIDHEVIARLKHLNIVPSDLSTDAEFLRRVSIDTIGCLPTPTEVRDFLKDASPDKRTKKVEQLLAHPLHAALWATKFCDITGNNTADLEGNGPFQNKLSQMWHDWFRKRLAENRPYDEIVRGVLCATSRDGLNPDEWLKQFKATEQACLKGFDPSYASHSSLDLFWRKKNNVPIEQWGEKVAAAFLGVRLECAQCHKHPFDRWSQADYRAFANIFGQVTCGAAPDIRKQIETENAERKKQEKGKPQLAQIREVYVEEAKVRSLADPENKKPLPAKALGGPNIPIAKGRDARVVLFDWMKSPDNPYFARSFVNRVWAQYMGVGLVDPVDDFSQVNLPSNENLLNALAQEFVKSKFDIRRLESLILTSRTYQLSSVTNLTNKMDRRNYSHSYVRPMMAEVVLDVLNSALDVTDNFGNDAPPNCHAIEVGSSRISNGTVAYLFRTFGRPPRTSACDCERALEPALPQRLFLMTDASLQAKFKAPKGRLQTLLAGKKHDKEIVTELFLAALSRPPTEAEWMLFTEFCADEYKQGKKKPEDIYQGVLWALINTREFILNH